MTKVKAEFIVTGLGLIPEHVTGALKINPTGKHRAGEIIGNTSKVRKDNCWYLCTQYEHSYDVNEQLTKILDRIKDKTKVLKDLRELYNLSYKIGIVINVENKETPAMYLDSETIDFAHEIGAEFDFDLYV